MAIISCKDCNNPISDKAKQCPKCGCPVVQKNKLLSSVFTATQNAIKENAEEAQKKNPVQKFIENSLVVLFLLFGVSSCIYRLGYPYTCEQAKRQFAEAESKLNERIRNSTRISDLVDTTNSTAMFNKIESERLVRQKCY